VRLGKFFQMNDGFWFKLVFINVYVFRLLIDWLV